LLPSFDVVGLSRREKTTDDGVEWRKCDLFSLLDTERAVAGARYAIYLVHSMQPAELTQASFRDIDWILADNFSRACEGAGVEQIIYLGGLIPPDQGLSEHLASRLEVARVLASRSPAVTALQAGLIIGVGGSSMRIMLRLVQRLPMMVCPRWTQSMSQPIALSDVVDLTLHCLGRQETYGEWYDIGGPDSMSYIDMMKKTAALLKVKRIIKTIPVFSAHLSLRWVQLFSGAPRELVSPLIESLRHDMVTRDRRLQDALGKPPTPFATAMASAIEAEKAIEASAPKRKVSRRRPKAQVVYSVQRLPLPPGYDAKRVAETYADWLPKLMRPFIRVEVQADHSLNFHFVGLSKPLLELTYSAQRSHGDRPLFYITGGLLADVRKIQELGLRGRLEFRADNESGFVMAAIYDFCPRLPWFIYRFTQAPVHLLVMTCFGSFLRQESNKLALPA
ncbi:MAG: NmrA family protein, partial [Myxococcota bacterium]|nr:NmrA family protein [Myxococcota bacterium]